MYIEPLELVPGSESELGERLVCILESKTGWACKLMSDYPLVEPVWELESA